MKETSEMSDAELIERVLAMPNPCTSAYETAKELASRLEAALDRERQDVAAFRYLSSGAQFGVSVANVCKERLAAREREKKG